MKKTEVTRSEISNQYPVILFQTGYDLFTVEYGKQIKKKLNYTQAAHEFGECVMHAAVCNSLIHERSRPRVPQCAATMGCLCAGHARGNDADSPCSTRE